MQVLGSILPWLQIVLAALLVTAILLQRSDESLGSAFGGSTGGGMTFQKRGLEKQLFIATIVLAALFIVVSIVSLFI